MSSYTRPVAPGTPSAYPVKLPIEAYKHLLSGKPYIRHPRLQRPTGEAETGA